MTLAENTKVNEEKEPKDWNQEKKYLFTLYSVLTLDNPQSMS